MIVRITPVTITSAAIADRSVALPELEPHCGGGWLANDCTFAACTANPETIAAIPTAMVTFPCRALTGWTATLGA